MPRKEEYDKIKADPERYAEHRRQQREYRKNNPSAKGGHGNHAGQRDRRKQKRVDYIKDHLRKNPCRVCGEDDLDCLQFHHLDPNEKEYRLAQMRAMSLKKIDEEIAKCMVLCANCHCKEHARLLETI